jgi:hypothetical protein
LREEPKTPKMMKCPCNAAWKLLMKKRGVASQQRGGPFELPACDSATPGGSQPTTQCSLEVVDEKKTAKRLKGSKCPLSRPADFSLHQQLPG